MKGSSVLDLRAALSWAWAAPVSSAAFLPVVAVAGLCGCGFGLCWPAWHVALEPAQVLAGIVRYPVETPFQLYETRVWNVWHQLLAPLLLAGVPERVLSIALSGVVTALGFAAVAAFACALGANAVLSLAAPLLVLLNQPVQVGFSYPILFLGYGHTYGMAGLSGIAFACAALAAERWRLAGFLIGFAPALHVSLGAWLAIAVALAALPALASLRPHLRALGGGFAVGAALSATSLAVHLWLAPPVPLIDAALADRYLDAFVRMWDAHRVPADLGGRAGFLVWCGVLTSLALLHQERGRLGSGPAFALRLLVLCGVAGYASTVVQRLLPVESLPKALLIAMPTRLANLVALLAVPLAVAVVWRFRADKLPRVLLLAASGLLALSLMGPVWWRGDVDLSTAGVPLLGVAALVALARGAEGRGAAVRIAIGLLGWLAVRALWRGSPAWLAGPAELSLMAAGGLFLGLWLVLERSVVAQPLRRHAWVVDATIGAAVAGIAVGTAAASVTGWSTRPERLPDRTNHPVLAQAASREGLLVVGPGLGTVQLRTRRPLLLDPSAIDMLPYALPAAPAMQMILSEVYAVDFFNPPGQAFGRGALPDDPIRALFERRTAEEWRAVRARFGVTDVLVQSEWRLRLHAVARGRGYALYALPE